MRRNHIAYQSWLETHVGFFSGQWFAMETLYILYDASVTKGTADFNLLQGSM